MRLVMTYLKRSLLVLVAVAACLGVSGILPAPLQFLSAASADDILKGGKWEFLTESKGVKVWKKDVPGLEFPGFRGRTTINASIERILEVMMDSSKHADWMYRCKESRILKEISDTEAVIYTRVDAPWPVWDRDAVMRTTMRYNADRTSLVMKFRHAKNPEKYKKTPEGVIRMPRLAGRYQLDQVGPNKTTILYEAVSDIGGSIPTWIANLGSRDLPAITLSRLRDRVYGKI